MRQINWIKWSLPTLLVLAVVVRLGTFFPSVINHDESTYFLIGKGLLEGQQYLVDSFDTKPIGVFLIYALMIALGGGSIFMTRLFTALIIGFTAYLIFLLARRVYSNYSDIRPAWAASISYILLCSIFKYYGLSPNTELFFTPFVVGSLLLVWGEGRKLYHYLLAGLLLGIAFVIKYVIAADAFAICAFLLWIGWKNKQLSHAVFRQCAPITVVFFVPMVFVYLYYQQLGQLDAFMFYTFEVTSKYPVNAGWVDRTLFVLDFFARFLPFTLLAIFALRERTIKDQRWQHFLLFWLSIATVMTLLPGKTFGHYQIQLMPPFALLVGSWFCAERTQQQWLRRWSPRVAWGALGAVVLGLSIGLVAYYNTKLDEPKEVSRILKERLPEGEQVYTGNYHHIVYHLLDQEVPTPYVHSSLLYYPHHVHALGIDLEEEAKHIIDGKSPYFVLLRTDHPHNELTDYIYQRYEIRDTLVDKLWLLGKK